MVVEILKSRHACSIKSLGGEIEDVTLKHVDKNFSGLDG